MTSLGFKLCGAYSSCEVITLENFSSNRDTSARRGSRAAQHIGWEASWQPHCFLSQSHQRLCTAACRHISCPVVHFMQHSGHCQASSPAHEYDLILS